MATNLNQHPTIVEENLDAEEKKSSSNMSSLLHTEHNTNESLALTNTGKKLTEQKNRTRNIESISSHSSSESDDESAG